MLKQITGTHSFVMVTLLLRTVLQVVQEQVLQVLHLMLTMCQDLPLFLLDTPKNPGQTVTWSTTASDTDNEGTPDTVKLIVCKTAGISGDACDGGGDTWCSSSLSASNPSCGYSIPAVAADGAFDAYVYVVDNHNLVQQNQGQFIIYN